MKRPGQWFQLLGALVLVIALTGCAADGPKAETPIDDSLNAAMQTSAAERVLSRLTNVENGLEVRRWVTEDNSSRIGEALAALAIESPLTADQHEALRRNGLRLVALPLAELKSLEQALAPMTLNLNEWHGQVDDWRALHERSVRQQEQVVAVNGRVKAYANGRFQLLIRSWVVPMESQPFLHVDLVPCFVEGQARRSAIIPQQQARAGERFDRLSVAMRLQADVAYVLTCEDPAVRWPGETRPFGGAARPTTGGRRRIGPGAGPVDGVGPDAGAPTTLGALLLQEEAVVPVRGLLVFVPRIAREHFPISARLTEASVTGANR